MPTETLKTRPTEDRPIAGACVRLTRMKPADVLSQNRETIRRAVARYPVVNPRVFGSVTHERDTDDSDLDLLVDPLPGTTLFDLGALQFELETTLGIPIDVLTPGDLPERFRERVMREALPV